MVLDPFSGTFAVFKACMLLDEHRRCIGGDIDEECVLHCESVLIEIYARQLLNTSSDLNTSDETQLQSARALVSELERLKIRSGHLFGMLLQDYPLFKHFHPTSYNTFVLFTKI